jgi:hypothetical protein
MNLLDRSFLKQFKTFAVRVLSDLKAKGKLNLDTCYIIILIAKQTVSDVLETHFFQIIVQ